MKMLQYQNQVIANNNDFQTRDIPFEAYNASIIADQIYFFAEKIRREDGGDFLNHQNSFALASKLGLLLRQVAVLAHALGYPLNEIARISLSEESDPKL